MLQQDKNLYILLNPNKIKHRKEKNYPFLTRCQNYKKIPMPNTNISIQAKITETWPFSSHR